MEEHVHPVIDDDPHFVIDVTNRTINHTSSDSLMLVRGDHNSERFTFEMPRHVDGHDMTLCDRVEADSCRTFSSTTSIVWMMWKPLMVIASRGRG